MSRRCQITGRGPQVGNNVSHAHNVTKRRFNVNLQTVRVVDESGRVHRMKVSTRALRSGLVTKPPVTVKARPRKVIEYQALEPAAVEAAQEAVPDFFSDASVVTRIFQKKPRISEEPTEESTDVAATSAEGETVEEDAAAAAATPAKPEQGEA